MDSRRFRVFCVIEDFTRECLAVVVDDSITGERVSTRELDGIAQRRGYPLLVVSDNGTEFISNAMLRWQQDHGVDWHYIAPGKPMQNGLTLPRLELPAGSPSCAQRAFHLKSVEYTLGTCPIRGPPQSDTIKLD